MARLTAQLRAVTSDCHKRKVTEQTQEVQSQFQRQFPNDGGDEEMLIHSCKPAAAKTPTQRVTNVPVSKTKSVTNGRKNLMAL